MRKFIISRELRERADDNSKRFVRTGTRARPRQRCRDANGRENNELIIDHQCNDVDSVYNWLVSRSFGKRKEKSEENEKNQRLLHRLCVWALY